MIVGLLACSGPSHPHRDPPDTGATTPAPQPTDSAPTDTGPEPTPPVCGDDTFVPRAIAGELRDVDASWSTLSPPDLTAFGTDLTPLGDIDGDALADFAALAAPDVPAGVVGGPLVLIRGGFSAGDHDPGALGQTISAATSAGFTSSGRGSIHPLADITGDGLPEVVLASLIPGEQSGAVWIFASPLGAPGLEATTDDAWSTIAGDIGVGGFGYASAVADVDGDGEQDVLVGAESLASPDEYRRGGVFVLTGPLEAVDRTVFAAEATISSADYTYDPYLDFINAGPGMPDGMGTQVLAPDLTGDGIGDVVTTGPFTPALEWNDLGGAGWFFEGPLAAPLLDTDADALVVGEGPYDLLGRLAADLGDLDGDGVREVALSAVHTPTAPGAGSVWIVAGMPAGTAGIADIARTRVHGALAGDQASTPNALGDLDGDGFDDLGVGAHAEDGAGDGGMYVFYGPIPAGDVPVAECADAKLYGDPPMAFGANLGDVDGDGRPDLGLASSIRNAVLLFAAGP